MDKLAESLAQIAELVDEQWERGRVVLFVHDQGLIGTPVEEAAEKVRQRFPTWNVRVVEVGDEIDSYPRYEVSLFYDGIPRPRGNKLLAFCF